MNQESACSEVLSDSFFLPSLPIDFSVEHGGAHTEPYTAAHAASEGASRPQPEPSKAAMFERGLGTLSDALSGPNQRFGWWNLKERTAKSSTGLHEEEEGGPPNVLPLRYNGISCYVTLKGHCCPHVDC